MRVTMRQLLSGKRSQKTIIEEPRGTPAAAPDPYPSNRILGNERVFPSHNLRDDADILNVINGDWKFDVASPSSSNVPHSLSGENLSALASASARPASSPREAPPSAQGIGRNNSSSQMNYDSGPPTTAGMVHAPSDMLSNGMPQLSSTTSVASQASPPSRYSGHSHGTAAITYRSDSRLQEKTTQRKVSERSQLVVPSNSDPETAKSGYLRCEDEPIRTPGAIQSFGALIGLKYNEAGDLEVRIASENSRKILGYGPEQLFALGSFLDILKDEIRDEMLTHIHQVLTNTEHRPETRLDFFPLTLTFPYEPDCLLWCSVHLAPNIPGMVICEFEQYTNAFSNREIEVARALPVTPFSMAEFDVPPEEFKKSTTSSSRPLAALEISKLKGKTYDATLDVFNVIMQAQRQIFDCQDVQEVQETVVGLISELTGYHRVMSYRFDNHNNGCVEAELVNPQASTDIFRGLHYPASDIPAQARELYKTNRIRLLYDRDAETSRLVCRDELDFKQPIDLTHSYLRAMSPMHNKYLANMGVRSSVSISIVIDGALWGLIACHGYGEHGIRISVPVRELCRSIGDCAAINIQRILMQNRLRARRVLTSTANNPTPSADLLRLVEADFAVLSISNKIRAIGRMEPWDEANVIISYLQSCKIENISSSHNIKADFPGLGYPPGINTLAGILIIPLNAGKGNDFMVFFRKNQMRHINWAGNPHEKTFKSESEYLLPRNSFRRFLETVSGTSAEWTEDQLDIASILALLYGRFAEALKIRSSDSSQKEAANEDLAPPPHPPPPAPVDDSFNLKLEATRVLEALTKETQRKALDLEVSVHDQLPTSVKGDADCFRQVLIYFIRNGFKYATSVSTTIHLVRVLEEDMHYIELKVQDHGPGMSESELDAIFQEFEQAQNESNRLPRSQSTSTEEKRSSVSLAVIAKYVRSINGQIQVTSEIGKGTIFTVELPFKCVQPVSGDSSAPRKLRNFFLPASGPPKGPPSMPPPMLPPKHGSVDRVGVSEAVTPTQATFSPPAGTFSSPATSTFSAPQQLTFSPQRAMSPLPAASLASSAGIPSNFHGSSFHGSNFHSSLDHKTVLNSSIQERDSTRQATPVQLNVLIGENDPTSLRMLVERLSQWSHTVDTASDGQECHDRFASNPSKVDVILVELKMPLVDGILATRMIRIAEKESRHRDLRSPRRRVPIIAISATLDEENRFDYIQTGFDGWILKPIDFRSLDLMLQGVTNPKLRQEALYVPGQLKKGGWFLP